MHELFPDNSVSYTFAITVWIIIFKYKYENVNIIIVFFSMINWYLFSREGHIGMFISIG